MAVVTTGWGVLSCFDRVDWERLAVVRTADDWALVNILPSQVNFLSSISPQVGSRTNLVKMASNRIEANLGSVVYNKTWDKNWKIFAEHLIGLKTLSLSIFLSLSS